MLGRARVPNSNRSHIRLKLTSSRSRVAPNTPAPRSAMLPLQTNTKIPIDQTAESLASPPSAEVTIEQATLSWRNAPHAIRTHVATQAYLPVSGEKKTSACRRESSLARYRAAPVHSKRQTMSSEQATQNSQARRQKAPHSCRSQRATSMSTSRKQTSWQRIGADLSARGWR